MRRDAKWKTTKTTITKITTKTRTIIKTITTTKIRTITITIIRTKSKIRRIRTLIKKMNRSFASNCHDEKGATMSKDIVVPFLLLYFEKLR